MSGGTTIATSETKIEALQLQSSAYGVTLPVVYGVTRLAGNLAWYGGFKAIPHTDTQESGGKGGSITTSQTSYTYEAAVVMGLCEGDITGIARIWRGKTLYQGGVSPVDIHNVSTTIVLPGAGGTFTPTIPGGGTWSTDSGIMIPGYGGDSGSDPVYLAAGIDYSVINGVYTFTDERGLAGRSATVSYQYKSGGVLQTSLDAVGLSLSYGGVGQATWSYLLTNHPTEALGYSGTAYVYAQSYTLGTGAIIENHNFEVQSKLAYSVSSSVPDAVPAAITYDLAVNARYGANFTSGRLGSINNWRDYCLASGILMSPALTEQQSAAAIFSQMAKLTNTGVVWSEGVLKFIPYGDSTITGNGVTYTPNVTPVYDLSDLDYINLETPIQVKRKPQSDAFNHVQVEFLNRDNQYNVEIAEAKDQANIDVYGLRTAPMVSAHWICDTGVARNVAQLVLQRALYVRNEYTFQLSWSFALLEPMDLVTLTDSALGYNLLPVRITEVSESEEGVLSITAEDFPLGTASASLYGSQSGQGFSHNYNVDPGNILTPVIFELPAQMTVGGLELGVAATSANPNWGGFTVWGSLDGTNYVQLGRAQGGSRYGTITGPITAGNLPVHIQSSQLLSGSAADANALATLCYVGGTTKEFLAYQTAALTGTGSYTLSGLVRGAYNSPATSAHTTGDPFVRVDDAVARSGDLDLSYVGKTVYLKMTSFNIYGGGEQALSAVSAYTYTITGDGAALLPGIGGKGVQLQSTSLMFLDNGGGSSTPSTITLKALRKGLLASSFPATFTVTAGAATLAGTGDTRTLAFADMTTTAAVIQVTVTDGVATYTDQVTISKVANGGSSAQSLQVGSTGFAFVFPDVTSTTSPSPAITYTAALQNITGSVTFSATAYDLYGAQVGATGGVTLTSVTATTCQLTAANFNALGATTVRSVRVTATLGSLTDWDAAYRADGGSDALKSRITNVAHQLPADSAGNVISYVGCGGTMELWKGVSLLSSVTIPSVSFSIAPGGNPQSLTTSINATTGVYSVTGMSPSTDVATVTYRVTLSTGQTLDEVFSISKSKTGTAGSAGTAGVAGNSARRAYALFTGNPTVTGAAVVTAGSTSFPATSAWSPTSATAWTGNTQAPASGQAMFQTDGVFNPTTNQTTWNTPYLSNLKVGNLAALSAEVDGTQSYTIPNPTSPGVNVPLTVGLYVNSSMASSVGVFGKSSSSTGAGVYGYNSSSSGYGVQGVGWAGVHGVSMVAGGSGVLGEATVAAGTNGVSGVGGNSTGSGLYGTTGFSGLGTAITADASFGGVALKVLGVSSHSGKATFSAGVATEGFDANGAGVRVKSGAGAGGYGVIHRNDGAAYYMLLTASGDADGSWTTVRPITVALSSGAVSVNSLSLVGMTVGTGTAAATFSGVKPGGASTNTWVTMNINGTNYYIPAWT